MEPTANGNLALIFILSMLLLFLVPWTLYVLFNRDTSKPAAKQLSSVQSAVQPKSRKSGVAAILTPGNVALAVLWALAILLVVVISRSASEDKHFDPYEILNVDRGATEREIKKAYRKLSLQYHPDKNPDPKAVTYFTEYVSPAYKALTDEESKANLEKYGHPDGFQGMKVGVALPAFLFENGKMAPVTLACIVGVGILLPLGVVVCYLIKLSKYGGNNVIQQTLASYFHMTEQKSVLAPAKVAEILATGTEFLALPVRRGDDEALSKLSAEVRGEFNAKDPKMAKVKPEYLKSLILLAAQCARQQAAVPEGLQEDFHAVLGLGAKLLDELLKMTLRPRPPYGFPWMRPALSVLEYSQHFVQAVPLSARQEKAGAAAVGGADGPITLQQLPFVDAEAAKKLGRSKVKSITELLAVEPAERLQLLETAGLTADQAKGVQEVLGAVPVITLSAKLDATAPVVESDEACYSVFVSLEREKESGPVVCPFQPPNKEEGWWLFLVDPATNALLSVVKAQLQTKVGLTRFRARLSGGGKAGDDGQECTEEEAKAAAASSQIFKLPFRVPPAGTYSLQVLCMSDHWLGCDRRVAVKLRAGKLHKAEMERRMRAELEEQQADEAASEGGEGSEGGAGSDAGGGGPEMEDFDDDLTESGTDETVSEDEKEPGEKESK